MTTRRVAIARTTPTRNDDARKIREGIWRNTCNERRRRRRRRSCARIQAAQGDQGEDNVEFVRTPAQEKLKQVDDSVRNFQKSVGAAALSSLGNSAIGSLLGIRAPTSSSMSDSPAEATSTDASSSSSSLSRKRKTWKMMRDALVNDFNLTSASRESVLEMNKDVLVLDVRPEEDYGAYHIVGAVNVPLYSYISSAKGPANAMRVIRELAFAAQGVKGVEKNETFVEDARRAIDAKRSEGEEGRDIVVVMCCANGGTMRGTQNFPSGQASRSLIGAYEILFDGPPLPSSITLVHLSGGLNSWFGTGGEGEGTEESYEDRSGRVPFVPGFSIPQDADELK